MEYGFKLSASLTEQTRRFFNESVTLKALNLIEKGKVNLSFVRGGFTTSLIVSGLVREDRAHECKISYKARLEGTEDSPLNSNCDCIHWTAQNHCQHAAALFLMMKLKEQTENPQSDQSSILPPISLNTTMSVTPNEFGVIVNAPRELVDAPVTCTYSSLRYCLTNKRIIDFPFPDPFRGKLQILLKSEDEYIRPRFQYISPEGTLSREISIFENLYLFDWKEGLALNLNNELKGLIQKIRLRYHSLDLEDYLRLSLTEELHSSLEVLIDDQLIDLEQSLTPLPRVTLEPGNKQGLIEFNLVFQTQDQILLVPPKVFTGLTFEGGRLGIFKKKKDAYDFILDIKKSIEDESDLYKRKLIGLRDKGPLLDLIEYFLQQKESYTFEPSLKKIVRFDHSLLRSMLLCWLDQFNELFYRFSSYTAASQQLQYLVTQTQLFSGLAEFNRQFTPYGLSVYYDRQELARWNSRIRFERRDTGNRWFDLELELSVDDLEIIQKSDLDQGLALTTKGLILLTPEERDLVRFMKRYTQYEGEKKEDNPDEDGLRRFTLPFQRARIFELFELKKLGITGALTKEEEEICERLSTVQNIPEYDAPGELNTIMRPYQKLGYSWLRFLYEHRLGACLADDMGLGKTLQTIAFLQSMEDQYKHVLIVCPVTILLNWENEFKKFSNLPIHIYHGGSRDLPDNTKIIITSYGVMKKEAETTLAAFDFDIMILDEVQHLKNLRSLGAYAARRIKADFRICLTGTPVENDLAEFYNILDLSLPGIWGDLQFIRTSSNAKSRLVARKTASPFILRRTKSQVLTDLPDKIDNTVTLSFSPEERESYLRKLVQTKQRIELSPSKNKYGEILKALLELRQSCLWQKKDPKLGLTTANIQSTKIQFLLETIEPIIEEGHQTIVFSQFTTYLDMIQEIFVRKHWKLSRIDGSQSIKKRQEQVDRFQEGKAQVFLISLKAGGVGLNLTAASYVFIMDPWWNPAVESQAIDRAHRIGQKNTLTVYRPIVKDTVEEKVLILQEAKKQLFLDLLPENDDQFFTGKLSLIDFENLLS
jgi:SNF2 family DNA or RNA helicase